MNIVSITEIQLNHSSFITNDERLFGEGGKR